MNAPRPKGFTLIELVVTLAVAGILMGVGVPSFVDAVRNSRISGQYNALVAALYLARSEAVKSSELVTVCSRGNDAACGSATDWTNGWIVFVDPTGQDSDTSVSVDPGDTVLRIEPPISGNNTITAYTPGSGNGSPSPAAYVRYRPEGNAHWSTGSIRICDTERGAASSRVVNVVLTGDIRPGRRSGTEAAPRDVSGSVISCPDPT